MTGRDRSEEIDRLVERRERDPRTHTFAALADLYRQAGELDRALEVVQEGLRHHPHFLNARLVHAKLLRELGREQDAAAAFRQVLEIDSENRVARSALTEIVEGVGETGSGKAALAVVDERPRRTRWLARLDDEWRNGTSDEAEATVAEPDVASGADDARESDEAQDRENAAGPEESVAGPAESATGSGDSPAGPEAAEPATDDTAIPEPVVATRDARGSGGGDLETATLAQLYLSQGLVDQAIGIYERLLARDPYNARLAASLEEVRQRTRTGSGSLPTFQKARPPIPRVDREPDDGGLAAADASSAPESDPPRRRFDDPVPESAARDSAETAEPGETAEPAEAAEPVKTAEPEPDGPTMREFLRELVEGHAQADPDGGDVDWPAWLRELETRG